MTDSHYYRPKTNVTIEAFRWVGQPPQEWPEWARSSLKIRYEISNLQIDGIHGAVRCNRGDWVIRKSSEDIYPCRNDVFSERWELVPCV